MDFCDKTILVTGASSGIGRALVERLAHVRCRLAIVSRRRALLVELAKSLEGAGATIVPYQCDVSCLNEVAETYGRIRRDLGAIEVAILSAGVNPRTDLSDYVSRMAFDVLGVNFFGVVNWLEYLIPEMVRTGGGHLVAVSSLADRKGYPKSALYCASKGALSLLFDGLRVELRVFNVKVTTVRPGFVDTPMNLRNDFRLPFGASTPRKSAEIILRAIRRGKRVVQFPFVWSVGNRFVEHTPLWITDRLLTVFFRLKKQASTQMSGTVGASVPAGSRNG